MGYKPDWQNQTHKKAGQTKCTYGVQSRELFHGAKQTVRKYADGSEGGVSSLPELREPTEADRAETSSVADLPELREPTAADRGEAPAPAKQSFGDAFKSAKDGSTFEWNGKQYKKEYAQAPAAKKSSYDIEDGKFMDVKPEASKPTYKMQGRAYVKDEGSKPGTTAADARRAKPSSFSLKNNSGKYVPSKGVAVDKD